MKISGLFYYGDSCHKSSHSEDAKCDFARYYGSNSQLQHPFPAYVLKEMYLLPSFLPLHIIAYSKAGHSNFHISGFRSCTSLLSFNPSAFVITSWSAVAACVQAITGYQSSYKPQDKYLLNCGWQLLPFTQCNY